MNWTLILLVCVPVLAVLCLGMVMRALADGGGSYWPVWLVLLVALCTVWVLAFRVGP